MILSSKGFLELSRATIVFLMEVYQESGLRMLSTTLASGYAAIRSFAKADAGKSVTA